MKVKLIVEGGAMKPGPTVAQQLGPAGINLGKLISDVNEATAGFKGMNVPVEIDVDTKTKNYTIKVSSPSVAELIKKDLGLEKGSGSSGSVLVGNIAIERLIYIAQTKMPDLLAKDLKSSLKLVVGTCASLGVLVDSKPAKEIEKDIDAGKYDKEIKEKITSPSVEKKKELDKFFAVIKEKQEKIAKAAAEAKAAEEAAKVAAAATTPTAQQPSAGATQQASPQPSAAKEPKKEKKK